MEYKWPLSKPNFTFLDKLKLAKFVLTNDRWTHGEVVQQFEKDMAEYVGVNYAVFTSSGSTANTLLAMYLKDNPNQKRNIVVFPSTTWITSVSPFIREGFTPKFIDINLHDFSIDLEKLDDYLEENSDKVACVFITSLIGFVPDLNKIQRLSDKYKVKVMMDNCENTFGKYADKNLSSYFTSTTSTYFGHQLQSVEGGFVFTNDDKEYEYFLMARNHGMTRHLPDGLIQKYSNPIVDSKFDFHLFGNNFRNSNLHAFCGLLDFQRRETYFESRRRLYEVYWKKMRDYLILPQDEWDIEHAPFCLPIIVKKKYSSKLSAIKTLCDDLSIESRPVISGNLLRQACFNKPSFTTFRNSEYLHTHGIYIGLHSNTTEDDVSKFCVKLKEVLDGKV